MTDQRTAPAGSADGLTPTPTLKERVEDFLAYEAELLDERRYADWLDLLADDIRYFMPIAQNVKHDKLDGEYTREGVDAAWFDEGKETLIKRAQQITLVGDHWAEEPVSRTTHLVANIRIESVEGNEIAVRSRFLLYVNRREEEIRLFVGKRRDVLRQDDDGFLIARRHILLDQSTLQAKNMTTFF